MQRSVSLDIVRCAAIFCVIGVHSFSSDRDYCFLQSILRTISVLGVPLFLLLTGYLNSNKTIDDYYKNGKWKTIIPNYVAYFILGSVCFILPKEIFHDIWLWKDWLKSVLNFTCTPYGWYMEMWIGLFFLTPFLNIILKNLQKKHELVFIITLLSISQIASFFNRNDNIVIPSYWEFLWPLSFYVTGHYLKNYRPNIKRTFLLLLFFCGITLEFVLNASFKHTGNYMYFFGGHDMISYYFLSVIFFLILSTKKEIGNKKIRCTVECISRVSFFMYLVSAVFDKPLYRIIEPIYFVNQSQFLPYRIAIYIVTLVLSFAVSIIYSFLIDSKFKSKFVNKTIR